jgi:hypothetical protein
MAAYKWMLHGGLFVFMLLLLTTTNFRPWNNFCLGIKRQISNLIDIRYESVGGRSVYGKASSCHNTIDHCIQKKAHIHANKTRYPNKTVPVYCCEMHRNAIYKSRSASLRWREGSLNQSARYSFSPFLRLDAWREDLSLHFPQDTSLCE